MVCVMTKKEAKGSRLTDYFHSRTFIETILESAVDAIVTIDNNGIIHTFNRAAVKTFGYEPNEIVGRNISALMPSPYSEMHDEYLHRYLKTGKAQVIGIGREVYGMRKSGSTFPMDLAVSEIKSDGHHYFVGILRDTSERKYMEKAIVTASENERREIGRDLHDALGQNITGMSLLAKSLAKKLKSQGNPLSDEAEAMADLALDAMSETKRLAYGAFPTELEHQGLKTALLQILERSRNLHKIETHFSAPSTWEDLDQATELHLYRIAQESVANAIKHGKPKNIRLILKQTGPEATLTIRDDGIGMPKKLDPDKISMGLDIMRHRASLISGTFTIRTPKGGGTEVICCIPDTFLVSKRA